MPRAPAECIDPAKFVLEAISEVFPVGKRVEKSQRGNDLGWACVLMLESLILVVVEPVIGKSRLLVSRRDLEGELGGAWWDREHEDAGCSHFSPAFGDFREEDVDLFRKLVVRSAWRKQMPKRAVSLGLSNKMPGSFS